MLDTLKRTVSNTPIEPIVRQIYDMLSKSRLSCNLQAHFGHKDHLYDLQSRDIMRRVLRPKSNCIDIGCHRGDIMHSMLEFSPGGMLYGFEPLPNLYSELKTRFSDQANVVLHNVALSDTDGETTFHHNVEHPGLSGLRKRHFSNYSEFSVEINTRLARLDDLVPGQVDIDFIKIDVEGAELQALRGAKCTIMRCQPIILFEHGMGAADYFDTTPEQVHQLLCEHYGLRIGLLEDWLAGKNCQGLSINSFADQFFSRANYFFIAYPALPLTE